MLINKPLIIKLLSVLVNIFTCLIAVVIVLTRQDWFGKGDTYSFVFWTIPFAVAISISGEAFLSLFRKANFLSGILFIIIISIIIAVVWTYCTALVLGPWIGAFSFPILYLWIVGGFIQLLFLNWRLPKPLKVQYLKLLYFPLGLISVLIILFTFSFIGLYVTKPDKELFLIPDGYRGNVIVIYNQKDGIKEEYEGGRRVYRIPKTGVLFSQFKDEEGIINQEYYYVSVDGKRRKLGVLDSRDFNEEWTTEKNPKEPSRDSLAIFNPGSTGTMGNSDDPDKMVFSELSVGTYKGIRSLQDFKLEYIDSLKKAQKKR